MAEINKNEINVVRHSLAHLLAAAVKEYFPNAKPTLGPAIDTGFFYDFDFGKDKVNDDDLKKIESKMKEMLPTWQSFSKKVVTEAEAKDYFKDNNFKLELIDEIVARNEELTLYTSGNFTDLCRGGHSDNLDSIDSDSFKLSHLAGAYWRGDEKRPMLTRIYGLAFSTKKELEDYEKIQEEAKNRDHKKLGKELDLFTFSELVGSGLPLWTPKGTLLRNLLDEYVWDMRKKAGYVRVEIPHITKKDLYEKSGHWDKFSDELFKVTTREDHVFVMKPMNCPHHTQIFDRKLWSYREMPQRYANTTMCYRDEQSGELSGLSRLRSFTQDDAHVFCRPNQIKEEFLKIWDIIHSFYGTFGFDLRIRLSLHDPLQKEKYLGDSARWEVAENMLREIVNEKHADFFEGVGEAAFYGPKLDFMAKDSLGRELQVATIQVDMNMPERFDLNCINEKGEKERIVMIHAAIMGSIERFLSVLIEHLAGNFPLWLSPTQVKILPISESHIVYAKDLLDELLKNSIRADLDVSNENLGKKIRNAKLEKTPYILVIGDKEISANGAGVESRSEGSLGIISRDQLLDRLLSEIKNKA